MKVEVLCYECKHNIPRDEILVKHRVWVRMVLSQLISFQSIWCYLKYNLTLKEKWNYGI